MDPKGHLVPNSLPLVGDMGGHKICCTQYFEFYFKLTHAPSRCLEIYPTSLENMHYFVEMQVLSAQKQPLLCC